MTQSKTYPLRLPRSLKEAAEEIAREEGTSVNQFIATAVAEKVGALKTARYFADRRRAMDLDAFDRVLDRQGGEAPREDDRLPPG